MNTHAKIANQESQTDGSGLVTDVDDEVSMEDAEGQTAADNLSKVALSQLEADSKSSGHRNGKPEVCGVFFLFNFFFFN